MKFNLKNLRDSIQWIPIRRHMDKMFAGVSAGSLDTAQSKNRIMQSIHRT